MVNATALIGKRILTSDGIMMGKVEGVEVDTANWLVTHLRVLLSKEAVKALSIEPPILLDVLISLPVGFVKESDEKIALNVPLSEIAATARSK